MPMTTTIRKQRDVMPNTTTVKIQPRTTEKIERCAELLGLPDDCHRRRDVIAEAVHLFLTELAGFEPETPLGANYSEPPWFPSGA